MFFRAAREKSGRKMAVSVSGLSAVVVVNVITVAASSKQLSVPTPRNITDRRKRCRLLASFTRLVLLTPVYIWRQGARRKDPSAAPPPSSHIAHAAGKPKANAKDFASCHANVHLRGGVRHWK